MTDKKIYKVSNTYINIENVATLTMYNAGFGSWYLRVNEHDIWLQDDEDFKNANELMERFVHYNE